MVEGQTHIEEKSIWFMNSYLSYLFTSCIPHCGSWRRLEPISCCLAHYSPTIYNICRTMEPEEGLRPQLFLGTKLLWNHISWKKFWQIFSHFDLESVNIFIFVNWERTIGKSHFSSISRSVDKSKTVENFQ